MLHGIGGNRTNWWDQIEFLKKQFLAIAWDARGYGDSDDYNGNLIFEDFSEDLASVLSQFGLESAHVVGLSMGGRIAMQFAVKYPHKVNSLALVDTHLGFQNMAEETRNAFIESRREPLLAGKETKDIAPPVAASLCSKNAIPGAMEKFIESMANLHKESYIKAIESSVNNDRFDDYGLIKAPTIVIVGEDDQLTPISMAEEIQQKISDAKLAVIPNAGHLSNFEQPDVFNNILADFYKNLS
jgi:3-oxoadipate enol-lactonase